MRYWVRALIMTVFLLMAGGQTASAHERWFVDQGGQHIGESNWLDGLNLALIAFGLILITAVVLIDRSGWYRKMEARLEKSTWKLPRGIEWRFVALLVAATLIANVIYGVFLAQDLLLPGLSLTTNPFAQIDRTIVSGDSFLHWWGWATVGGVAQLLLALVLLTQTTFLIPGALILIVALPIALLNFAPDLLVDYVLEFTALAFALIFFGMGASRIDRWIATRFRLNPSRLAGLALPVIRIGVGLTFVVLSLHDKLLDPNMALSFLDKHDYNFMQMLGFVSFTNIHFAFAAGIVELSVGLLLTLGIATRLLAAIVVAVMGLTISLLGARELAGHLPIMGITLLLIYRGTGGFRLSLPARKGHDTATANSHISLV